MVNAARTLNSIAPLSTLYCPLTDLPTHFPKHINIDPQSEWYRSALLVSAVESVTLPVRLRTHYDFETSLLGHRGGSQTIFELQSSILGSQARDLRPPWATKKSSNQKSDIEPILKFDVSFSIPETESNNTVVFNQVQVFRGEEQERDESKSVETGNIGLDRKLRLYASKPAVERYALSHKHNYM